MARAYGQRPSAWCPWLNEHEAAVLDWEACRAGITEIAAAQGQGAYGQDWGRVEVRSGQRVRRYY